MLEDAPQHPETIVYMLGKAVRMKCLCEACIEYRKVIEAFIVAERKRNADDIASRHRAATPWLD